MDNPLLPYASSYRLADCLSTPYGICCLAHSRHIALGRNPQKKLLPTVPLIVADVLASL
jgi:hypothetical protein